MGWKFRLSVQTRVDDRVQSFQLIYNQTSGSPDPRSAEDAALSWLNNCTAPLRNILATDTKIQGVHATRIDPLPGTSYDVPVDDLAGLRSGTALPAICCLVLNFRNSASDLPRPGRVFISGCSKLDLVGGVFDPDFRSTQVTAFAASILTIPSGGGSSWGGALVVRRTVNANLPIVPPTFHTVNTIDDSQIVGRQRDRKSKMIGK